MSTQNNIPTASDLIALGDPKLKEIAQENNAIPSHLDELNLRINELEIAIGQDNSDPIGRAFAIRAEASTEEEDDTEDSKIGHFYNMKEKYL